MAKSGNSIIKGIEITDIIKDLNSAFADEWLSYYQYMNGAAIVKGLVKDSIRMELLEHGSDEFNHSQIISKRILQLGGIPIQNPKDLISNSVCGYEEPKDFGSLEILKDSIKGEKCAIKTYSKLLDKLRNKDVVTYDIISDILAQEVEHESDLQSIYEDIKEFDERVGRKKKEPRLV